MERLQAEIQAIQSQIDALQAERRQIQIDKDLPTGDSLENMVAIVRRQARENAERFAELKGIEDAITMLTVTLKQKEKDWQKQVNLSPIEKEVESGRKQAAFHATRINQLADELVDEVKSLKRIADHISPDYWQVYYKPFMTGFSNISVPYVRSDGDVWTIRNRIV